MNFDLFRGQIINFRQIKANSRQPCFRLKKATKFKLNIEEFEKNLNPSKFTRCKAEVNWQEIKIEGISEDYIVMLVSYPESCELKIFFLSLSKT
jgi:hypothetical protein